MGNIIEAIKQGDMKAIQSIIAKDQMAIEERDNNNVWAPFLAAQTGHLAVVKFIVEYTRASMNQTDEINRNILHYAAMSDSVECVRYLVDQVGMDIYSGDKYGKTPIDIALEHNNMKVVAYLREEKGIVLEEMYRNPIVTGAHPDPSIIRVGEDYYMVNSTFIYFPAIPILHSKDLINWRIIGHGVTDPTYLDLDRLETGRGIWAPDISYHKGKFYITATYRLNDDEPMIRKQIIISSDRPEGPYSKPVFIEEDGIDPSLFVDEDGKRYMLLNRGARLIELNLDATKKVKEAELIYYGHNKRAPEGPHLIKKDNYYYLFLAEGGTGLTHCITVARSKNIKGPYEPCPYNPLLTQKNPLHKLQRSGHGKPVQTQNGDWYIVYLCGRPVGEGYCILGRETAIDPLTWTADGWPMINNNRGPSVLQYRPNLPKCEWKEPTCDHFDTEELGLNWLFARIPDQNAYTIQDSHLRIYGSYKDLNEREAKNIVLKRQKDHCFEAELKLNFYSYGENQEAGMTCYYDTLTYIKAGVINKGQELAIRVVERVGDKETVFFEQPIAKNEAIYIKVVTQYLKRTFYYRQGEDKWRVWGTLENVYYLSDEGEKGKRFTGAMVGMYAVNGLHEPRCYADFDYFNYQRLE